MIQVQLEAGQHRFLAVNELHPNDSEQKWWIIQIYRRPLSVAAFQRLRGNDPVHLTALSDGDRLFQTFTYAEMIEALTGKTDPESMKSKERYHPH